MIERRLDDAGDERRLREGDVAHVLAEVNLRRFGHAVQGKRAAMAEIDVVQVELEDLVLGRLRLEDDRHEGFERLPSIGALAGLLFGGQLLGEEEVARELLRDGAAAFDAARRGDVAKHRATERDWIDARVDEEAVVFDGDEGVLQMRRDGGNRHVVALFVEAEPALDPLQHALEIGGELVGRLDPDGLHGVPPSSLAARALSYGKMAAEEVPE